MVATVLGWQFHPNPRFVRRPITVTLDFFQNNFDQNAHDVHVSFFYVHNGGEDIENLHQQRVTIDQNWVECTMEFDPPMVLDRDHFVLPHVGQLHLALTFNQQVIQQLFWPVQYGLLNVPHALLNHNYVFRRIGAQGEEHFNGHEAVNGNDENGVLILGLNGFDADDEDDM